MGAVREVGRVKRFRKCHKVTAEYTAKAVWDSDTLSLLRSECKGIKSLQGSGSKGDASCTTRTCFYVTLILF